MSSILEKLSKVLAQAENAATPEEADAYLTKAQYMSTRYSIDLATARAHAAKKTQRETPIQKTTDIGKRGAMGNARLVRLFITCANANDVQVDIAHDSTTVYAFGFPSDIEVTEALYVHLVIQMVEAANAYLASDEFAERAAVWNERNYTWQQPSKKTARLAFYEAFTSAIANRLYAAKRDAEEKAEAERLEALAEAERERDFLLATEAELNDAERARLVELDALLGSRDAGTALVLADKRAEVSGYYKQASRARGTWKGNRQRTGSHAGREARRAGDQAGREARLSATKRLPGAKVAIG